MLQSEEATETSYTVGAAALWMLRTKAGFLKDITAEAAPFEENLAPNGRERVQGWRQDRRRPIRHGRLSLSITTRSLFKKAGVNADAIKTWDDFLGAVKALKAAGITPIINGGGDKWPMHFYYSYLIMRIGGENALSDAKAGKNGGFKNSTFVEAGKRLRELAALEPFQPGYLATKYGEAAGMFGDGKGAMELMFELLPSHARPQFNQRQRAARGRHRHLCLPHRTGRAKERRRTHSEAFTDFSSPRARLPRPSTSSSSSARKNTPKRPRRAAAISPIYKGTATAITDPLFRQIADILSQTTYHQNFLDQDLGPSVGRVINDVSVSVAEGKITPEAAAAAIQEAADQQ